MEKELLALAEKYIEAYGLKRKNLNVVKELNNFQVKESDNDGQIKVSGYLSTYKNVDRQNDVVKKGAFDTAIKGLKKLPILKDHKNMVDSQLGSFNKFQVDDKGLYVEGKIPKTDLTTHVIKLIEQGHLDTFSMGGMFRYADRPNKAGNNVIEEVFLLEGSIVSIPANPKATFTMKSLDFGESEEVENSKASQVSKHIQALELLTKGV